MKPRYLPLVLVAGLAFACRAFQEDPQPAAEAASKPAQETKQESTPAMLIAGPTGASEVKPTAAPGTDPRADRLAALSKEQSDAMNAYFEAIQAAMGDNKEPTAEDWARIQEQVKEPDTKPFAARAQALLDEDPTDITAFHTIAWMLDNAREPGARPPLIALLVKHHIDRPEMGEMCNRLAQDSRDVLEKLVASSPHHDVRGQACYALAEGLKNDIQYADYVRNAEEKDAGGMKEWLGAEKFEALKTLDVDKTQKEIEAIYDRVVKEFGDVKLNAGTKRETTLGKRANAELYEIRMLVVGKPAPEIEGVDLDSVAFKLSDYRGKVVLLDFWGNW